MRYLSSLFQSLPCLLSLISKESRAEILAMSTTNVFVFAFGLGLTENQVLCISFYEINSKSNKVEDLLSLKDLKFHLSIALQC